MAEAETLTGSAPASAPYFLVPFFGVTALIIGALWLLRMLILPTAVLEDPQRRGVMALLPSDETAALKLEQAEENPRYDVGLFGNSRIMMVGTGELGLGDRRVFNFAIGGQSIRQSIRLLEELFARDKAPRIAIISMDHVELGLPGGAGVLPGPPRRWWEALADVETAWRMEGFRSALVQAINATAAEGQQFTIAFSHFFVQSKLRALIGVSGPASEFRADGSRREPSLKGPFSLVHLPQRADTYPQLERDFAHLAAIRDAGVRVMVYESPVAPSLGGIADAELSAKAIQVRRRFHAACQTYQLECYGPPLLNGISWIDPDHAPAKLLGAWLRSLIEKKT